MQDPQIRENMSRLSFWVWVLHSISYVPVLSTYLQILWFPFFKVDCIFIVNKKHIFITHSSAEWHLGCFCFLAIVNAGALHMAEKVSVEYGTSPLTINQGVLSLGHMVNVCVAIKALPMLISTVAVSTWLPINREWGSRFPHILACTCCQLFSWS